MSFDLQSDSGRSQLAAFYQNTLIDDTIPFWMEHGRDREHGGIITAIDRDGSVLDTDKSIWFQGRTAWMFAKLWQSVERRSEWLEMAQSCIEFIRRHGADASGKLYFSVTRDGRPLRMRRYVYSEAFAAMAHAAWADCSGDQQAAAEAVRYFANYLAYSFEPQRMKPKTDPQTRPMRGIGPLMFSLHTAQEVRAHLGDISVSGKSCTEWIDWSISEIERLFVKPEHQVVLETVGPQGEILNHFDGRLLNPGHAIECAWFILHEGRVRNHSEYIKLGLQMLDWMWVRGWDETFGGLFYFRDVFNKPVQEYWHDMKFWWPHCEAIIATWLAWSVTGEAKYARWHQQVHDWSFAHFPDHEFGEWYGYLHRDGRVSVPLKGNLWKGPYHLPRMLWYCSRGI